MPIVAVFIFEIHFFHRSRSELPCLRIPCAANDAAMQFGQVGKPRPLNANILHFSLGYTSNPEEPERWILSFTEDVVCAFPASLPSSLTWGNCGLCGEIHELLKSDDMTRARTLIKDDPSLVIRKAEDGFTPLRLFSGEWLQSNAELLLTNKAEVNAKDNNGSPPLHQVAAAAGRHSDLSEISEMMRAHGADVNAADKMDPPLAWATHSLNHSGQARAPRSDCLPLEIRVRGFHRAVREARTQQLIRQVQA
jgi:hypothetical protein